MAARLVTDLVARSGAALMPHLVGAGGAAFGGRVRSTTTRVARCVAQITET